VTCEAKHYPTRPGSPNLPPGSGVCMVADCARMLL